MSNEKWDDFFDNVSGKTHTTNSGTRLVLENGNATVFPGRAIIKNLSKAYISFDTMDYNEFLNTSSKKKKIWIGNGKAIVLTGYQNNFNVVADTELAKNQNALALFNLTYHTALDKNANVQGEDYTILKTKVKIEHGVDELLKLAMYLIIVIIIIIVIIVVAKRYKKSSIG